MRNISILLIIALTFSCGQNKKNGTEESTINMEYIDSMYAINTEFKIGDVRRYGVEPSKSIGQHPKLLKDKLEVLLDISELGIELYFPKGVYDRTFNIDNRKNVNLVADSAIFTGAVNIKNSIDIKIEGTITSLSRFYTQNSSDIDINTIVTKTDTLIKGNTLRSTGCSIHGGSHNVSIKKAHIFDSGSGSELYKYIKGGFLIHGHNNEPTNIKVDTVIVESSDRHGAYLSGEDIDIKFLHIKQFGIGTADNMAPMEGGIEGEQKNFAGIWIKNCHNSFIDYARVDLKNSGGTYSVNFDIGEDFRPTVIEDLLISGVELKPDLDKRIFSRTGVKYYNLTEN
ncbi:MAG: hypothetical protein HKN40_08390 [Winogradskyella sp.]|uniref:hypothetical protein n=1 Tax=Winogradskyella sp. TaxID=1883156 RepID=UPI0017C3AC1F|nr:hypothetical protein [Winogradskyella sp.]